MLFKMNNFIKHNYINEIGIPKIAGEILYPFHEKAKQEEIDTVKAVIKKMDKDPKYRKKIIDNATKPILKKQLLKALGIGAGISALLGTGIVARKHLYDKRNK